MEILKYIFGVFGGLVLLGGGVFAASKLRGFSLKKKFATVANEVEVDKESVHKIDIDVAKAEQQKADIAKQIQDLEATPDSPPPTGGELIDFFDKMSKK